ncbi:TrkH family potassium uptake protein [Flagellatimonas centrodinii]|nr:TrkH family potassium uptake protein [Flagellatimonas centrodinii]ULQ48190.1 TrkH family potassium uptake protein [Flagellatimonas centrodinii]
MDHRYAPVQRIIGLLLMGFSLTHLGPLAVSLALSDGVAYAYLDALWITLTTGALLWWTSRHTRRELKVRDGFLVTVLLWAVMSLFGAVPLYVAHAGWNSFIDALFESTSGLTTTGTTVIASGLDLLPPSINYYRVQLHWLGGMGIIVLAVAVMPMLGVGGMQLYRAETPGPVKTDKLTPRIAETARILWTVYLALTLAAAAAYRLSGMSSFDAICHAMSTIATGGFSTHDASIGHYQSPLLEWVVMVFMLLGTVNFAVHFTVWRDRNPVRYLRDAEVRTCLLIIAAFALAVCLPLIASGLYADTGTAIRKGLFHVISYGTTSGFATADPTHWPAYLPVALMLSGFVIGCAGSTSGGVKVMRVLLFAKQAARELRRLVHPRSPSPITVDGRRIPDEVVYAVGGFFSVYIACTLVLTCMIIATGLDPLTAFSAVAATLNNMGPGLGEVNAAMHTVSPTGKGILIAAMLLGRLEIFSVLVLFTPMFWRR